MTVYTKLFTPSDSQEKFKYNFNSQSDRLLVLNQAILLYSVLIGVAIKDATAMPIEKLLSQADKALYEAKDAGRNLTRIYASENS